jgi:osmoprotectant transport system permease protein
MFHPLPLFLGLRYVRSNQMVLVLLLIAALLNMLAAPYRYAFMPVLLAVAVLGLWLWVSGLELDTIEQRVLNWRTIRIRLIQHVQLSLLATAGILVIAVPLGIMLTRPWARRLTPFAVAGANAGQAIPSLGVLVLAFLLFVGFPFWTPFRTAVLALIIYGILPVLRNTMVGIQQVDPAIIEAGRGMGLTRGEVLRKIELPLAVPVILAGVRISLILAVGTAALATLIGAGGLGSLISTGIGLRRNSILITGAVSVAVLALFIDWLAGVIEDLLRPKGL